MISGPMAVVFICNGVPYFVYLQNSDSTVGSRRRLPSVGESSNSSLVIGHDDSSVTLTDDVQGESCEEDLILTSSKRCRMALASDESDSDVTEGIEQKSESKDMQTCQRLSIRQNKMLYHFLILLSYQSTIDLMLKWL